MMDAVEAVFGRMTERFFCPQTELFYDFLTDPQGNAYAPLLLFSGYWLCRENRLYGK